MKEKISDRAAAKAAGEEYYFTGRICTRGHVAKRLTETAGCVECPSRGSIEKIREYRRAAKFKKKYGMPISVKHALIEKQRGKCAVCASSETLFFDHCHQTGMARGALCHNCNVALGHAKDSPEILRKMIIYLGAFR